MVFARLRREVKGGGIHTLSSEGRGSCRSQGQGIGGQGIGRSQGQGIEGQGIGGIARSPWLWDGRAPVVAVRLEIIIGVSRRMSLNFCVVA